MKLNTILLGVSLVTIVFLIFYINRNVPMQPVFVNITDPSPIMDARPSIFSSEVPPPEYRPAPVRQWKPPRPQQMGLLTSNEGDIKPLFGRASNTHRDRWHYWTTTDGNNLYPLPIQVDGRECEDDIGCNELFGGEKINIFGNDAEYKPKLYRVDDYF